MLVRDDYLYQSGMVIMSDTAIIAASARATLLEISKQAAALGTGLQNAAPGDKSGAPNNSVQYLLTIAESLSKIAEECTPK